MKVLISGSNGFVGRRFVCRLLDQGDTVVGVDNLVEGQPLDNWMLKPLSWDKFTFEHNDIRAYIGTAPPSDFDLVIHCAAIVGGRIKIDGDPLAVATDLAIDSTLLNWIVRPAGKMPRLIYFSSSAVYPVELQTKDCHCNLAEPLTNFNTTRIAMPDMTYGYAKLTGEYLCKFAAEKYGLDVAVYRPFGGYGEDQSLDYPFPSIVKRIVDGEDPIVVWGSGDQQRDFVHVEDIVDCVLQTYKRLPPGQPLNIGTGQPTSFRDLAHMIANVMGKKIRVFADTGKPQGVFSRVADTYKLDEYWKPRIPLERGIAQVVKALTNAKT